MSTNCKSSNASSSEDDANELRRGPWTAEEDTLLIHYIARHGEGRWNLLAKLSGLRRTGKSCRLRWLNYLKPDVKRGNLTSEEQLLIFDLHAKWGNRWSKIAQYLPGRTDNEIKNYWRTRVQKQAKHLKMDIKSTTFQDIVRRFWVPRLIQKIQGSTSSAMLLQINPTAPMPMDSASQQSYSSAIAETSSPQKVPSGQGNLNMSMNMQHIPPFSEYPNGPFQPTVLSNDYNTAFVQGCSNGGDKNDRDIGAYNHTTNVSSEGFLGNPIGDCHVAGSNWAENEFLASMWNVDEFWQYKS